VTNISRLAACAATTLALAFGVSAAGSALAASAHVAPALGRTAASRTAASRTAASRPVASGTVAPAHADGPVELSVRPAVGSVDSLNSAGYAVSRSHTKFRFVQATFFVPYLNCGVSAGTSSSDWIGLDGFVGKPHSVEQAGIGADCSAAGHSSYHAWYAMYPRAQTTAKVAIHGGDSITASVSYDSTDSKFTLSLTDNTTGGHFRVRSKCPHGITCPRNSAEMISAAPTTGKTGHLTVRPLADYGAVSFAAISIVDRAGQRGDLRSANWGATRIVQTEQTAPFRLIARPTSIQADTFDNYWSRER
jgi:Peptidase A4 family